MTKEELAKKKGIRVAKEEKTPSESLITTVSEKNVDGNKAISTKQSKSSEKKEDISNSSQKKATSTKEKRMVVKADNKSAVSTKKSANGSIQSKKNTEKTNNKPVKRKVGRPKTRTEDVKIANIAIPVSVYEQIIEYALPLYNGNMTEFVNHLIEKDLNDNLKEYKTVRNAMIKVKK